MQITQININPVPRWLQGRYSLLPLQQMLVPTVKRLKKESPECAARQVLRFTTRYWKAVPCRLLQISIVSTDEDLSWWFFGSPFHAKRHVNRLFRCRGLLFLDGQTPSEVHCISTQRRGPPPPSGHLNTKINPVIVFVASLLLGDVIWWRSAPSLILFSLFNDGKGHLQLAV